MSEKRPYQIPDFIVQNLNDGQAFSQTEVSEIENILAGSERFQYPQSNTNANWDLLRSKIESPLTVLKPPVVKRQFAMFRWAAAAVIVLSIGIGFWQYQKGKSDNFAAIYKTSNKKEWVKLPDGTTINLNTFTEVEVKTMNSSDRVLVLKSGEAFFNVTHNDLPFKVETSKGDVMVTGTEFNIKNRENLPFAVFLKQGKVRFKTEGKILDMNPGECLKKEDKGFVITRGKDQNQFAWISGKIVFNNQSLADIITELEATYQVKFKYDDKLAEEKYNFVCDNNLSAAQVADLLTKLVSSKVSVE